MEKILPGIWIKKILPVVFLLSMTGISGLFAIDIKLNAPKLDTGNPLAAQIQPLIDNAFMDKEYELQGELGPINLQKMTGAFADSSIFSSTGASLRTYQGYSIFALTVGTEIGFQLPVDIFSMLREFDNVQNEVKKLFADIQNDRDLRLGLNPQILNAQLGINLGFLLKGLYLGAKGGYMNISLNLDDRDDFKTSFQTWSAGGLVNYQLIPRFRLLGGIFMWRGLNLGAGFVYQNTGLKLDIPFSKLNLPDFDENGNMSIPVPIPLLGEITGTISNSRLSLDFNVITYTVPLEAVTSIRLLGFLNVALGVGADLGFGSASLEGDGDAIVTIEEQYGLQVETPGSLSLSLSKESSPNLFNPKAMASFGFSAGPAIILDIPITYYFRNNGFNFGITLGIAL